MKPEEPMIDPTSVLDLMEGFRRSKTLFAAVELGIFDGERPEGAAIGRLLDACVALGLLTKQGNAYSNTPLADVYLRSSSPRTLAGYVRYSNEVGYRLWNHLEDAVREGTNRWEQAFGPGSNVREFMSDRRRERDFMSGMHGLGLLASDAVVRAFDLSGFSTLVDLGGGTGHLAMAARRRYPGLRVIVFDRPEVIEIARDYVDGGIELVAGDFRSDPLPNTDVFALGRILHSQNREESLPLLKRIWNALPDSGAVLVAESLLGATGSGFPNAHMRSLNMLVVNGNCEHTLDEYADLLSQSGFNGIESRKTGQLLDAVFARKLSGRNARTTVEDAYAHAE
jgi:acetylserotonin N-methyltransferase